MAGKSPSRTKLCYNVVFFMLILLGLVGPSAEKEGTESPRPTRMYQSGASSAFVYDNILGKKLLRVSAETVRMHATWFFVHPDPYEGIQSRENGDLHWIAPFSPKSFAASRIWKGLQKGLDGTGIFDGKTLFPYDVEGIMLLRGFSPAVYRGM